MLGLRERLAGKHVKLVQRLAECVEVALGQRPELTLYGTDYPTPDGTCVRDYVHVVDLASAHVLALDYLVGGGATDAFNVGVGRGSSVREVLDALARATGIDLDPEVVARRPGDPARVVASADRIREVLGWSARHDLDDIVRSAWAAWQAHPAPTTSPG